MGPGDAAPAGRARRHAGAEGGEEGARRLGELHPQRPARVGTELRPQRQGAPVDHVVLHAQRHAQVEEEARPLEPGRPGVALPGVAGEVHQQGHEPERHGDGVALAQHPAVARPDPHGQAAQDAKPRAPTTRVPGHPEPGGGRDVVVARVGEHLEEADDPEHHREAGLEHPRHGPHPDLAQQHQDQDQRPQCVGEERHRHPAYGRGPLSGSAGAPLRRRTGPFARRIPRHCGP